MYERIAIRCLIYSEDSDDTDYDKSQRARQIGIDYWERAVNVGSKGLEAEDVTGEYIRIADAYRLLKDHSNAQKYYLKHADYLSKKVWPSDYQNKKFVDLLSSFPEIYRSDKSHDGYRTLYLKATSLNKPVQQPIASQQVKEGIHSDAKAAQLSGNLKKNDQSIPVKRTPLEIKEHCLSLIDKYIEHLRRNNVVLERLKNLNSWNSYCRAYSTREAMSNLIEEEIKKGGFSDIIPPEAQPTDLMAIKPDTFRFTVSLNTPCISRRNTGDNSEILQLVNNCDDGLVLVAAYYVEDDQPARWHPASNVEFRGEPLLSRTDHLGQFVGNHLRNDPEVEGKIFSLSVAILKKPSIASTVMTHVKETLLDGTMPALGLPLY